MSLSALIRAVALLAFACAASNHVHAASECATAWSASTAYNGGDVASQNSVNYRANWWTQGDEPASHNGAPGSGQPWTVVEACEGDGGGGNEPPDPIFRNGFEGLAAGFVFSPYKDVTINMDWNTNKIRSSVLGSPLPLVGSGGLIPQHTPGLQTVTLAFATGQCGSENWGGIAPQAFADANIPALVDAGIDYIIATGGAAGAFNCADAQQFEAFITRYASERLRGIDFDIETGQTPAQIQSLVAVAAAAQANHPQLRFSFTLATLAASDGSYGGLNSTGATTVQAIQASSLSNYTVNLMVMDYGATGPGVCVVVDGQCDMGASAIQAAVNLMHTWNVPIDKIELTPMIGLNDVVSETFTDTDVDTVMAYARDNGLAGVHFWSLDRDTPCAAPTGNASPICNSVEGTQPLQYTLRFLQHLP
ncbi:MAG: carbohydrate-binding protein [Dokdonella sp.]|uniref:carbohydrate-binding protein n=1 Tax=Dokdonella sp. TaxID=2291710 RepID=UPI0025BDE007|nr:carbohydrate-binding protein [Dokdonella sp.]MBZ0221502.1 carbohydrate-binding protein [Dokdonella sp.]MCC7255411.1 carbohydrate-binding protein [Dokdonella sp.]